MTTLIAVYNSSGCVGRCDAKCYNAKEHECTCVCGGANHGVGRNKAMANTEQMANEWIKEYSNKMDLGKDVTWSVPSTQPTLL